MKRTSLRKQSKSERSILVKHCDDLFRNIIRLRDKVCQRTSRTGELQVAHFFDRKIYATRWDKDNACLLQKGIHYYWAHVKHEEFRDWWIKRIGQRRFNRLKLKADYKGKVYTHELKIIKIALQKELEALQ